MELCVLCLCAIVLLASFMVMAKTRRPQPKRHDLWDGLVYAWCPSKGLKIDHLSLWLTMETSAKPQSGGIPVYYSTMDLE